MFLYHLHSGLRYLVLCSGAAAILWCAILVVSRKPYGKGARITGAAFTGLLDLQVLAGLILFFSQQWYPAVIGHLVMMILAAATQHGFSAVNKRRTPASPALALVGIVVAMGLIIGGILAIGKPIVGR